MNNRRFLNFIVATTLVVAIFLSFFSIYYLSPSFTKLIINNAESEAIRVGRHLSEYFQDMDKITSELPGEFTRMASQATDDFGLMKVKVFASNGETVYSTSEKDIGEINEKEYFHNVVAKGRVFSKVIYKDTRSLEGQLVKVDVVETYVPIMHAGSFVGAFEVYFDITANKKDLDDLLFNSNVLLLLIAVSLVLAILVISFIAKRSFIKQELAETEREKFIAELQKALDEIKTLRGIIPICMYCKKIKSEKGIWDQLEIYIEEHSDADFSHGVCPSCFNERHPEIAKKHK
jgi:hypothetical protein